MEHNNDEMQINILEVLSYLKKKIWIIVLAALICGLVGFFYNEFLSTPQYTASTRVYILNRQDEDTIFYADLQSSSQFINDYTVLITGQNVTKTVVDKLDLEESFSKLASRISVTAPEDTRILEISVTHEDPQLAADIANAVREEATGQIEKIMDGNAVNLVYEADTPMYPSSPGSTKIALVAAVLGLCGVAAVLVVIFILDDTIRTEEDVEKYLSLSVLGVIPDSSELGSHSGVSEKDMKGRLMNGKR